MVKCENRGQTSQPSSAVSQKSTHAAPCRIEKKKQPDDEKKRESDSAGRAHPVQGETKMRWMQELKLEKTCRRGVDGFVFERKKGSGWY